jgi:hypothetical protein
MLLAEDRTAEARKNGVTFMADGADCLFKRRNSTKRRKAVLYRRCYGRDADLSCLARYSQSTRACRWLANTRARKRSSSRLGPCVAAAGRCASRSICRLYPQLRPTTAHTALLSAFIILANLNTAQGNLLGIHYYYQSI